MIIPPRIEVASLGMWDGLILMIMALVVFGPRRLPEIGRQIGKLMYELRKASSDFKIQIEEELRNAEEADRRRKEEERLQALAAPEGTVASDGVVAAPAESAATASPYPGEGSYPAEYPPETTEASVSPTEIAEESAAAPEAVMAEPTPEEPASTEVASDSAAAEAAPEASPAEPIANSEEIKTEPVNRNG